MKGFVDLHLCPPIDTLEKVDSTVRAASKLEYKTVGITVPRNVASDRLMQLRAICRDYGVDMATRVDLSPRSAAELLRLLQSVRRRFEVVAVVCGSKPVARQAAKDRRVDLLSFRAVDARQRFFDRSEAELASKALAGLEVDMWQVLSLSGFVRMRLFSTLRRELAVASCFDVPVVFSSGAASEFMLRAPRDLAAFATLFDVDAADGLKALSATPFGIVARNRAKLKPEFVAPGIRVVRRGRDC